MLLRSVSGLALYIANSAKKNCIYRKFLGEDHLNPLLLLISYCLPLNMAYKNSIRRTTVSSISLTSKEVLHGHWALIICNTTLEI